MSKILGLLRLGSTARKLTTAIVFVGVTVVLLLWLAGSFHPKIDDTTGVRAAAYARAASGRPIGSAQLVPVRTIRVPISESAVGTIRAVHETALASKLLAKVIAVDVKAGAEVRRDDILVRLDDADLRARLKQAEAAADDAEAKRDQARIEHDRIKMLLDSESASRVEFDRARTALKSAEAELRRAEQARLEAETIVSYALIRSPIDGIAVDKRVEPGDTVTPGQVLVNLYDPTRMQLVARVRESLTRRLTVGQTIDVRVESLGKTCQGRVSEIVPEAESASRTFSVKVTGPCPQGIYSGMFGRLLIPLDDEDVIAVPRAAIRNIGQLNVVDVAVGEALHRRIVQVGRPFGELVEVLSGLREGERVAIPAPRDGGNGEAS